MTEPTRYLFVHLQKTGGTALLQRLREHFGEDAVYPAAHQGVPATSLDVHLLLDRFAERREETRMITGHFPLATADLLGVPVTSFTLLREPVARTLSMLRHRREVESEADGRSLESIYADPVVQTLATNHMVKLLALTADEVRDGALSERPMGEADLERALANLQDRVDLFGLQEHFDDFCGELEARYGFQLGRPRFANRTAPVEAPSGLAEQIAADNELDVRLYATARELWMARRGSAQ